MYWCNYIHFIISSLISCHHQNIKRKPFVPKVITSIVLHMAMLSLLNSLYVRLCRHMMQMNGSQDTEQELFVKFEETTSLYGDKISINILKFHH